MVALFLLSGLRPPVRLPLAICFVYLVYFPSILGAVAEPQLFDFVPDQLLRAIA
jgi:hypothetical protein